MNTQNNIQILDLEQGSQEWLSLRKTKITATDASIIMGVNPWKNIKQLYDEKKSDVNPLYMNSRMQRGVDLEPIARDEFIFQTGIFVSPKVVVNGNYMASLDGMSACGNYILEVKCPNEKDHALAVKGKVPEHYYPQLQHQIYVCNVQFVYYFSYDGNEGVIVKVKRDDEYINKMIIEENKFYECLINDKPPELPEDTYLERNDYEWQSCASKWRSITRSIKELEKEEEALRQELIALSGELNCKGAGISLCQIQRKGNIDYSKIPELKNIDLELYRKNPMSTWRISTL